MITRIDGSNTKLTKCMLGEWTDKLASDTHIEELLSTETKKLFISYHVSVIIVYIESS